MNIENNATATILNNVIANFNNGILADPSSVATGIVVGGNLYQTNRADSNVGLGDFSIVLQETDPLFVDRDAGNFNLAAGSPAIDSSIDVLSDRLTLIDVSQPLGIDVSPILVPELDVTGQLRVDDPSVDSPAGVGNNVFKDRGAVDRADFLGPTVSLLTPRDNDVAGADVNPTPTVVQTNNPVIRSFEIQIE